MHRPHYLAAVLIALCLPACRSHEKITTIETKTVETRRSSDESPLTAHPAAPSLDTLIANLQTARTPEAEAEAIRALRRYETDHGLTYNIKSIRLDTNTPAVGPTALNVTLRTQVSLFKGQQPLRTFSFIPKDNRNLALLGE